MRTLVYSPHSNDNALSWTSYARFPSDDWTRFPSGHGTFVEEKWWWFQTPCVHEIGPRASPCELSARVATAEHVHCAIEADSNRKCALKAQDLSSKEACPLVWFIPRSWRSSLESPHTYRLQRAQSRIQRLPRRNMLGGLGIVLSCHKRLLCWHDLL